MISRKCLRRLPLTDITDFTRPPSALTHEPYPPRRSDSVIIAFLAQRKPLIASEKRRISEPSLYPEQERVADVIAVCFQQDVEKLMFH